jgi:hypothetical protein
VKVFWIWIANAMIHSIILYWMPMFAYESGVVWGNGRDGGYLVVGNMVYTVRKLLRLFYNNFTIEIILVCRRDRLSQSWINHKFVDLAYALLDLGINWTLVLVHVYL